MKFEIKQCITVCLIACFAVLAMPAKAQSLKFEKPYQISENLEAATSSIITYRKTKFALMANADSSANYVDLNGEWKVKFLGSRDALTNEDLDKNIKIKNWGSSSVDLPSAWQVKGRGDALYSKEAYPFLDSKPRVGEYGAVPQGGDVALYARDFSIPFDFTDRKQYINIGAAASKVTLYINGVEVGFSTDSKNPAQFEISKYTVRGSNRIQLLVEEFSGASWVEDASSWRLNGVNRGVYMMVQPKIRVRDVLTSTTFDANYQTGLLQSALLLKTELLNPHTVKVYYDLYDAKGDIIRKENKEVRLGMRTEDTVRFHSSIPEVEKWNSETPSLYTVVYTVERENRVTEIAAVRVGFREFKTQDAQLLVNGEVPQIRGVNLEEVNPQTGNVLSREELKNELLEMRQMGLNAIRTGGYPMPQYFYDLTDSIGFYVFSIANTNTQGLKNGLTKGESLANNPAWTDVFVDRAVRTYERTKNNASVVAVGLGEDAGNGYAMYEAYNAIRERNANQIIVYDGANAEWNTDVACPLYPTIGELEQLKSWKVLQPIIPSRVKFDKAYWVTTDCQGAFIDRWQTATLKTSGVKNYKELSDDYQLKSKANGVVDESSAKGVKNAIGELFRPIEMQVVNSKEGVVRITNRLQMTNLNQLQIRYKKVDQGKTVEWLKVLSKPQEWKQVVMDCAPGESVDVVLEERIGKGEVALHIGDFLVEMI